MFVGDQFSYALHLPWNYLGLAQRCPLQGTSLKRSFAELIRCFNASYLTKGQVYLPSLKESC